MVRQAQSGQTGGSKDNDRKKGIAFATVGGENDALISNQNNKRLLINQELERVENRSISKLLADELIE